MSCKTQHDGGSPKPPSTFGGTVTKEVKNLTTKKIAKSGTTRKVYRDNVYGITNNVIARLAHKAGVKTISGLIYKELRAIINNNFLEPVVQASLTYMEHANRVTVSREDVLEGFRIKGFTIYSGGDEANPKKCKDYDSTLKEKKSDKKVKPGMKSLKEIRHYQTQSDCVYIARAAFERLVKEIVQDVRTDAVRWSSDAMGLLQQSIEAEIVNFIENANLCAIHAGRQTLQPKDLQLVMKILNIKT
uniref:Core Histone H2A/H2B/H3 domain-containing protein n=1 Tax=viral metagenome TaxID=1070528 RepID=A0A6C0BF27_9ZZZZ